MTRENIVEVTRQGLSQALGSEYAEQIGTLSPTNSAALVDLGTAVTSAQTFEQLLSMEYSRQWVGLKSKT